MAMATGSTPIPSLVPVLRRGTNAAAQAKAREAQRRRREELAQRVVAHERFDSVTDEEFVMLEPGTAAHLIHALLRRIARLETRIAAFEAARPDD